MSSVPSFPLTSQHSAPTSGLTTPTQVVTEVQAGGDKSIFNPYKND